MGLWLRGVTRWVTRKRCRFALVTPPFLSRQVLLAKDGQSPLQLFARDRHDMNMYNYMFLDEPYSFRKMKREACITKAFDDIVRDKARPFIVDCGANIGSATVYFGQTYPQATVVAIEPEAGNFAVLERNCAQLGNVRPILAGVSNQSGMADTIDTGLGHDAFRTRVSDTGTTPLVSMNDLLREAETRGEKPFIVKIDIEGFEAQLFSSDTEWVDKFPVVIIEFHDWMLPRQKTSQNALRVLAGLDRDFILKGENIFSISNRLRNPQSADS
ncbi:methyltransferase, FkbM family domain protein [Asticcacaulis biprosthecium C19]|uniref:Methyltransferase, FkbM family domain protein n=1 Tax=Asticcacaulis biprosthecium C19 TaxID=715226 RepID=F4QQ53_9CAUL|nr:methyltransferase, FkbM family domain protein [Asticcacaulis biprosthecium C19]